MKCCSLREYLYPLFLIVAGFLVYYPILGNQLLDYWDDQWVVMNYYTESGINFANIWAILTEFYHGQYAPFNEYLYLFLYSIAGYDPTIFHLASLLLHIANACLVFYIFKKLLIMSNRISIEKIPIISFLTALIFVIHPFNVESVAWMSASKVLVYAFFYLLATYTFLIFLERKKGRYFALTLIFYVFSFLGKEQAVTFPLLMLLVYWLLHYKFNNKEVWITVIPFFVLSLFFGIITMLSQSPDGNTIFSNAESYPLWQRVVYACYSLTEYFFKCIFPFKLSYLYPFPSLPGEPLPTWLLVYPVLLVVIVLTLWKHLTRWPLAFGLLFFIIHIAVALHIISLSRFAVVADRYAYVSSIGIAFIVAYYFYRLYEVLSVGKKVVLLILFCIYLMYLGVYSNVRTRTWYNVDTLKKELRDLLKERNDYKEIYGDKNDE
ncbi:hypothetical protein [Coprobacter tertius]|uniref:Glycosyltransferase RgtA/B/C/D-like domain-containing protein n=1 Tax=Coprobacter tertius TaxID=2944915 RepID=A0ABT1MJE4_9BACT|nr:hypothetical protein [Coprobacter tertius]MCP9611813.1 hypothetical protein [Coprobacter tertius]